MVWCNCKLHVLFHTCESSKFSSNRFLKIFLHSDNVVDYLDVDGDEVGDSEGKESWLLEAPDISLSTTNPSFASIPYFLKYFLDILFSFSCYFPQHVAFPSQQTIHLSSPLIFCKCFVIMEKLFYFKLFAFPFDEKLSIFWKQFCFHGHFEASLSKCPTLGPTLI